MRGRKKKPTEDRWELKRKEKREGKKKSYNFSNSKDNQSLTAG